MSEFIAYSPGQRIAERYAVHAVRPGVAGDVYLCLDEEDERPIALKMLRLEGFDGDAERALLDLHVGEWHSIVPHPNVARCRALEVLDGHPVIVMDWIAGELTRGISLRDWLRHSRMLSVADALRVTMDLCRGLIHAAGCVPGIVHQNLKPENLLVAHGPIAKVTDFGIAGLLRSLDEMPLLDAGGSDSRAQLTQLSGTPWYMAPEQWLDQPVGARTDVYAIGCMLHEMLTGQRPYEVRKLGRLRSEHLTGALPSAEAHEHLPAEVSRIVIGCMQKAPKDRFDGAAALLIALERAYIEHVDETLPTLGTVDAIDAAGFNNRGIAFASMKRYGAAIAEFDRAMHAAPEAPGAYVNRADVLRAMGRLAQANNDYDRAIAVDDTCMGAFLGRGITQNALDNKQAALADFEAALALAPQDADALCERGSTLAEFGRFDEALVDFRRAIAVNERSADAHCRRGALLARLGHHDDALDDLNRAIELSPRYVRPLELRLQVYETVGKLEEALADCDRLIKRQPKSTSALISRGRIFVAMGDNDDALRSFRQATKLDPRNYEAWCARAQCLVAMGRGEEALEDFSNAVEIKPQGVSALHGRGKLYLELARAAEALTDLQEVVALAPRSAEGFNDLGGALDTLGRTDDALASYQRAIELKPDLAAAHLNIGVCYGKKDQLRAALPYFQRAAALGDARAERYAQAAQEQLAKVEPAPPAAEPSEPADTPFAGGLITPQSFAVELLTSVLDRAQIAYEVSADGRVTVVDRFRYWLLPEASTPARFIRMITAFQFHEGAAPAAQLSLINRINVEVATVRAAVVGAQLVLDQYLWLEGGVHPAHLAYQIRAFSALIEEAMKRNTDGVIR